MLLLNVLLYCGCLLDVFGYREETSERLVQKIAKYIHNYVKEDKNLQVNECPDERTRIDTSPSIDGVSSVSKNLTLAFLRQAISPRRGRSVNLFVNIPDEVLPLTISVFHPKFETNQKLLLSALNEGTQNALLKHLMQQAHTNLSISERHLPGNHILNKVRAYWVNDLITLRKPCNFAITEFHKKWSTFLPLRNVDRFSSLIGGRKIPIPQSIEMMHMTNAFMKIFWPFRFDIGILNQKLALYGITGRNTDKNVKSNFFRSLRTIQHIDIPFKEEEVVLSFDDASLVEGLRRTNLLSYTDEFVQTGKHRFNESERIEIASKTKQALRLIRNTSPELYRSIVQLVGCIAYYKSAEPKYFSGTKPDIIGVISIHPDAKAEWTVPFYAEQIVHEFTHNAVFYAELVHGAYDKHELLTKVKTMSAIRREQRYFDGSFHAAYVSAGLVTFHARAERRHRAEQLATPLRSSVDELVEKNKETKILDESGNAMLEFLDDYMQITKLQRTH